MKGRESTEPRPPDARGFLTGPPGSCRVVASAPLLRSEAPMLGARSLVPLTAAMLLVVACGKDTPEGPPGETVAKGWTQPSTDTGIASIQQKITRRLSAPEGERIDPSKEGWRGRLPLRPTATFDAKKTYLWNLETSEGRLRIRLRATAAPEHVSNLVYLTLVGFYDGLSFHSIVPGKSAVSGDPTGTGKGSPGYVLTGPELDPPAKHDRRGLLSAVSFGPSSDDAKFRLTFAPDPALDEYETVYGEVVEGERVLAKIEALGTPEGQPTKPVTIK